MEMYQGTVEATLNGSPAISAEAYNELQLENANLSQRLDTMTRNWEYAREVKDDLTSKINAVRGHIMDIYSEDGEIDDRIKEIAEYLGITLTKRISGDATFTISWSAQVPLDFDPDDFEISFDVDCDTYESEDFEWNEENTEINAEED